MHDFLSSTRQARARSIDKSASAFHIQQVDGGFRIGTARREDAECIADALGQYGSKIDPAEDAWTVVISAPPEGPMVSDLLSALKACLDENEIEDQSYVMES